MIQDISCSLQRIFAMLRRHWYLLSGSWTRIVELIYWPAVQMIMWGFLTQFLASKTSYVAQAFGVFLAGMMLWDSMFRVQLGVAISLWRKCGRAIWAICSSARCDRVNSPPRCC